MSLDQFTKEAVCELLNYLAENETFPSLKGLEAFSVTDVQNVLKGLAHDLQNQLQVEAGAQKPQYSQYNLSPKAMSLISCLSPREELLLFKSFKLL